jgi:hypothetical protein
MLTLLKPSFPHRHNADGSHDSICRTCYATVATVQNQLELARHESAHVCDPLSLYRATKGWSPQPRIPIAIPRAQQTLQLSKHDRLTLLPSRA